MAEANKPQIQLRSVVFDCPDPPALARFYGQLLGGTVREDPEWSEVHCGQVQCKLAFQRVDGYTAPEWPEGQSQQLHGDFTVLDLPAASTSAVALGARVLNEPVHGDGGSFRCMPIRLDIRSVLSWSWVGNGPEKGKGGDE